MSAEAASETNYKIAHKQKNNAKNIKNKENKRKRKILNGAQAACNNIKQNTNKHKNKLKIKNNEME